MFINYHPRAIILIISSLLSLFFPAQSLAQNKPFDRIVGFGASLSDTGNVFILLSNPSEFGFDETCGLGTPANKPPYEALDDLLIPDGSYAKGGHHVTNGATWVEYLARGQGLAGTVRPAFRNVGTEASNYAVGGARALNFECRFNLSDQLDSYFADFSETSKNTLVIMEIGGNDVRDVLAEALNRLSNGEDPLQVQQDALFAIFVTAQTIAGQVQELYENGARHFLFVNVPAIGRTPAVRMLDAANPGVAALANFLAEAFNGNLNGLAQSLNQLPENSVKILDLYTLLNDIIATPENFGIVNTTDACIMPGEPPFKCKKPDTYLFWDGIHPTKVVHEIMAHEAVEVLFSNE
ncbi:MAG: SGNH/GDSL hydrolase family protein [Gammaproteobacteria bacterium]